jgi:hypothetical protein
MRSLRELRVSFEPLLLLIIEKAARRQQPIGDV